MPKQLSRDELLDQMAGEMREFPLRMLASAYYLKAGIKNSTDLLGFLVSVLDLVVPNRHNCDDPTHCSPFDFLCKMFFGEVEDAMGRANRSGGKSFLAGLLTYLRGNFRAFGEFYGFGQTFLIGIHGSD